MAYIILVVLVGVVAVIALAFAIQSYIWAGDTREEEEDVRHEVITNPGVYVSNDGDDVNGNGKTPETAFRSVPAALKELARITTDGTPWTGEARVRIVGPMFHPVADEWHVLSNVTIIGAEGLNLVSTLTLNGDQTIEAGDTVDVNETVDVDRSVRGTFFEVKNPSSSVVTPFQPFSRVPGNTNQIIVPAQVSPSALAGGTELLCYQPATDIQINKDLNIFTVAGATLMFSDIVLGTSSNSSNTMLFAGFGSHVLGHGAAVSTTNDVSSFFPKFGDGISLSMIESSIYSDNAVIRQIILSQVRAVHFTNFVITNSWLQAGAGSHTDGIIGVAGGEEAYFSAINGGLCSFVRCRFAVEGTTNITVGSGTQASMTECTILTGTTASYGIFVNGGAKLLLYTCTVTTQNRPVVNASSAGQLIVTGNVDFATGTATSIGDITSGASVQLLFIVAGSQVTTVTSVNLNGSPFVMFPWTSTMQRVSGLGVFFNYSILP